jgi:hypothetical protein
VSGGGLGDVSGVVGSAITDEAAGVPAYTKVRPVLRILSLLTAMADAHSLISTGNRV